MIKYSDNDEIIRELLGKVCQVFADTEEEDEFDANCEFLFTEVSGDIKKEVFELFATMFNSTPTSR